MGTLGFLSLPPMKSEDKADAFSQTTFKEQAVQLFANSCLNGSVYCKGQTPKPDK